MKLNISVRKRELRVAACCVPVTTATAVLPIMIRMAGTESCYLYYWKVRFVVLIMFVVFVETCKSLALKITRQKLRTVKKIIIFCSICT